MAKTKAVARVAKSALAKDERLRSKIADGKSTATLDSFVNFQHSMGIGADNPMSSSSYGFNPITRQRTLLEWIHRGSWIGGIAVDSVADDMTRAGVDILGDMDPEDIADVEAEATRLGIWNEINDAVKWARLYGGCLAVMLVDGQDPKTPLRLDTIRKEQFCGLLVLDRWMVEPALNDLVTAYGPHLGLPKFYRVTSQAPALSGEVIHHTRCVRLEGIRLPYWQRVMENLWGLSVLERLYDRMVSFDSATTGAAQLVYKSYIRTYKIKDLRKVVAAGGQAMAGLVKYTDFMRRMQGVEGITMLDAEDEFEGHTHGAFAGLSDALVQFGQQLSGALQIPLVRLFGQSPAGFSTGDTDLRNYYDKIKQEQEKELMVPMTDIYKAIVLSLGKKVPNGFALQFRSLWQLDDNEKADIANKNEQTVAHAEENGLIDRPTALKELRQMSKTTGVFSNITDEMVNEAEQEAPALKDLETQGMLAAANPQQGEEDEESADKGKPKAKLTSIAGGRKTADGLPAAGILFVDGNGDVLLLKRTASPLVWDLPGGGVEAGETLEQAARREAFEETGYRYDGPLVRLGGIEYTTFMALVDGFNVKLCSEHSAAQWVRASAPPMDVHPGLADVLALVASLTQEAA